MDDGQRVNRGGVTLCTDSFKHEEIEILRDALASNFQLTTSIHNKKTKNSIVERIYINKSSLDENKDLILPHIENSMLYKLNQDIVLKQDTKDLVVESLAEDNLLGLFEE